MDSSLFFNLNGYLLLMFMFSLHHDVMRENELNLARMGLEYSESNMVDASLKSRNGLNYQLINAAPQEISYNKNLVWTTIY